MYVTFEEFFLLKTLFPSFFPSLAIQIENPLVSSFISLFICVIFDIIHSSVFSYKYVQSSVCEKRKTLIQRNLQTGESGKRPRW